VNKDINLAFCRALLKQVMAEVRKHATGEEIKNAWVYGYKNGRDHADSWEFHGPGRGPIVGSTDPVKPPNFYWYGSADNAYDARAQGWQAWLEHYHPEAAGQPQGSAEGGREVPS
jgi:hypothetical protein